MYDTIIIGAGIAGLTAAMYASRKRMKYELISKDYGGQFMVSGEVLNYPGIVKTTGIDFLNTMKEQMKFNNVNPKLEEVKEVKKVKDNFKVITSKGEYETQAVIIATGSRSRMMGIPGEGEFNKKGVTYCAICDAPLFKDMPVAVIGGGDSALEAVDFLKDIASKIYLVVRKDKLKAHEYLQERVKSNKKVEILFNTTTEEVIGDGLVSGLKIKTNGEEKQIDVKGIFVEIGRIPNTDFIKDIVENDNGHIIVDMNMNTKTPGIFSAGDCIAGSEYQYVVAAGQGCVALLQAAKYLARKKE